MEVADIADYFAGEPCLYRNKEAGFGRRPGGTEFFRQGGDAEGLPEAVQGNLEGMGSGDGVEQAVEADVQEVQPVRDVPRRFLVTTVAHGFQIRGRVAGMAAEGFLGGKVAGKVRKSQYRRDARQGKAAVSSQLLVLGYGRWKTLCFFRGTGCYCMRVRNV
jgi:hypothetical protein